MDPTIIHYYDRPGTRELVHLVQEAVDKLFEMFRVVRALDDIQSDDPIEGQRREDRVPVKVLIGC